MEGKLCEADVQIKNIRDAGILWGQDTRTKQNTTHNGEFIGQRKREKTKNTVQ